MLTGAIVLLAIGLFPSDARANFYLAGSFNGEDWNNEWKDVTNKTITISLTTDNNLFQIKNSEGSGTWYAPEESRKTFNLADNQSESVIKTTATNGTSDDRKFVLNKGKYEVGVWWHNDNGCPMITVTKLGDKTYYYYVKTGDNWYEKKGELNKDNNYSITVNTTEAKDNIFFLSEESDKNGNWETIKSITVGPKANDTYWFKKQSETIAVSKQTAALMKYDYASSNKATLTLNGGQLTVEYDNAYSADSYFLSGDLNGWMKLVKNDGDASDANTLEEMLPYKFTECSDKEGWYELPIVPTHENKSGRMHGQFQILKNGNFHADHWGHNKNRESESNDYWNNTMSDDASNPTIMKMVTGNVVISNHHLAHNYYKDATIYFNPTTNQCYIDGTPQDIYVYYYNKDETNPDNIKINMKSSGYTGVNYSVNPSLENATFQKGTVGENGLMNGEEHEQLKALYGVEGAQVLYAPVAPGLEESFWADRKEHYYNFGITGAQEVDERETFVFKGENIYFINYKLGSITLNLRDYNDNEMHVGQMYSEIASFDKNEYEDKPIIESIEVRLIALDGDKARYVTEEIGGRTNDPKKALTYRFNMHLKHGSNQFAHDIEGEYAHLDHWNGLHSTQPSSTNGTKFTTIYDPSENWEDDAVKIPLQHSNRYVELRIKLTDLENEYHGAAPTVQPVYLSNFNRTENEDGTVTLTMKQNDPTVAQAVAYSDVAPNSTNFSFDGSHKYFTYKFDDPDVVTGVKDIDVEGNVEGNAEAVYYTLQGVKTDKPVKGQIYIVVRGNKSSKVVY